MEKSIPDPARPLSTAQADELKTMVLKLVLAAYDVGAGLRTMSDETWNAAHEKQRRAEEALDVRINQLTDWAR